ncbi:MAG TPA: DNA polymerase IV [Candidatus Fimivicinus intestinavium]|nr:DNA polymerase IV [Candidatus Fimivicinus intestinavium]
MERLIFHVDVNSAYLSWEAARRTAEGGEDLRLIPSAIGGDPESRTGVILAKSIPAKKYSVRTGEPVAMALRKCPQLVLAKPDFRLYEKNSRAFLEICRRYAPVVEKFSIDECFLDMSGTQALYPDPVQIAHTMKDEIREELGFTVNVGISRNKLLAKMASDFEKPDKVHTLFPEEIPVKLWPLPVRELFSVGGATAEKLERAGIRTIGELAGAALPQLQSLLGKKMGQQLHDYANGMDSSPVLKEPEEAKAYSISTTLAEDVTTLRDANQILLELADRVTARMRADHARAACISVSIRSRDFKNRSHQRSLDEATDVTNEVYEVSKSLLTDLWRGRFPLRLIGISLTQLTREDEVQLTLFRNAQKERARKLDQALDNIRGRYGVDKMKRGSTFQMPLEVGKKYRAQLEENKEADNF